MARHLDVVRLDRGRAERLQPAGHGPPQHPERLRARRHVEVELLGRDRDGADDEHGDVVGRLAVGEQARDHVVAQLRGVLRALGHGLLEGLEPGVDRRSARLDEPVRVHDDRRSGLQLGLGLRVVGARHDAEREGPSAFEVARLAARAEDERGQVTGAQTVLASPAAEWRLRSGVGRAAGTRAGHLPPPGRLDQFSRLLSH